MSPYRGKVASRCVILEGPLIRLLPALTCALLTCAGLAASGLSAPLATAASAVHCSAIDLPVSVPTPRERMHGQLCMPVGQAPTTVQLLVHGGGLSTYVLPNAGHNIALHESAGEYRRAPRAWIRQWFDGWP